MEKETGDLYLEISVGLYSPFGWLRFGESNYAFDRFDMSFFECLGEL